MSMYNLNKCYIRVTVLAFCIYVCVCVCLKSLPNEIVHYSVECKIMLISQGLLGSMGFKY